MPGQIRIGIGGWTYEPWRGVFYPHGLAQSKELVFASRALTSIEINGTFYSRFKPASWRKWRDQTPDDFVFAVKASRYCTNRRVLAEAGPAVARFLEQGLSELGAKLGPINWQFAATKRFDPDDFEEFLKLLPAKADGLPLRHALEVRHPSFDTPDFERLARRYGMAIVRATGGAFPCIEADTAPFTYARVMETEDVPHGIAPSRRRQLAADARGWAKRGDVFLYFIAGAKQRNPAAAMKLIEQLDGRAAAPVRAIKRSQPPAR